jgi:hypothetical protein
MFSPLETFLLLLAIDTWWIKTSKSAGAVHFVLLNRIQEHKRSTLADAREIRNFLHHR